jgi:cytochrome c
VDEGILPGEFVCPASVEGGKRLRCEECLACHGGEYKGQATPVIQAHGTHYKPIRFVKMQKMLRNKKKYRKLHSSVAPKYRLGKRIHGSSLSV